MIRLIKYLDPYLFRMPLPFRSLEDIELALVLQTQAREEFLAYQQPTFMADAVIEILQLAKKVGRRKIIEVFWRYAQETAKYPEVGKAVFSLLPEEERTARFVLQTKIFTIRWLLCKHEHPPCIEMSWE